MRLWRLLAAQRCGSEVVETELQAFSNGRQAALRDDDEEDERVCVGVGGGWRWREGKGGGGGEGGGG